MLAGFTLATKMYVVWVGSWLYLLFSK